MAAAATAAPQYKNDFIELHNRSNAAVDLSTWTVQYASSAGTTWSATKLSRHDPAGRLLPRTGIRRHRHHDGIAAASRRDRLAGPQRHQRQDCPDQQPEHTERRQSDPRPPSRTSSASAAAPTRTRAPARPRPCRTPWPALRKAGGCTDNRRQRRRLRCAGADAAQQRPARSRPAA